MPKFPLFEDCQLFQLAVSEFHDLLRNPNRPGATELIGDLLDLRAQPDIPMSEALTGFMSDLGLFSICQFNFLNNTVEKDLLSGPQAQLRLELHHWILVHAESAGFLPAPKLSPPRKRGHPSHYCETYFNRHQR